ncbi:MAG: CoA transferase [Chloroflexi bacterium]|nr:CoA transferase [Chloroflexota bacterium]
MSLPLTGINVLEMAQVYAGPAAAMHLADQGAEVIKVEPPGGDNCRQLYLTPKLVGTTLSKPFLYVNRNKRGIVLDLTTQGGRQVFSRLARWADVFIHNQRPAAAARLGIDYPTLAALNPRLVHAHITAYGDRGTDVDKPGYDLVLQAQAGILATRHYPDGTPVTHSVMVSDMSCGMMLAYTIMLALWQRQATGRGQAVHCSLLGQALAMQGQQMVRIQDDSTPIPGSMPSATSSPYRCADDRWLIPVVLTTPQWKGLCRVLGLEHLGDDPAFATNLGREQHALRLHPVFEAVFATQPRAHWLPLLEQAGVPCAAVVTREEAMDNPQVLANEMVISTTHPALGGVQMMGWSYRLGDPDEGHRVRRQAPLLGQHTSEILQERGYSAEEIAHLRAEGAVQGQ